MKARVYIETSVVSYVTGRPTRDMVIAAHQELTREWWETRAPLFDLVVSELVREEAARGDAEASDRRMRRIETLPVLEVSDAAVQLAEQLVSAGPIPEKSAADALHIAIAAVNGADYLLTWNCTHLANAAHRHRIEAMVEEAGYACPIICTPEELMED
jgi:predicted nucleic acid-binding protein